jgi:hypothetical protein
MRRRDFMTTAGALTMSLEAQAQAAKTGDFLLHQYFLKNGTQGARLAEYLKDGLLEATARLGVPGPRIVLEGLVAAHMPQVVTVTPYTSPEQMRAARARLAGDAKHMAAFTKWESGDEAPYESFSECLLEAAPYCPELPPNTTGDKPPRVFELRVYHSPTERQLKALHERFAGPEIQIFHRSGVFPILYSSTLIGPMKPNLVYLTPFDDLAAREKAWGKFGADPEWVKVRAESVAKSGQISSVIQISLFKAAAYSPLR